MVKKNSKKQSRKMQLRDEVGDDDSNPITITDNAPEDCPPPEIQELILSHIFRPRHSYDLRHIFINYEGKWGRMSPTSWVDSDYKGGKSFKYGILCGVGIIYEEYVRDIAVKVNDHHGVGSYILEGNMIEVMCLYNGLPFVIRCTDDLRDMWAKGDESYPMRTQFYIKLTDVVRENPGAEAGEYIFLDEDDNDYIISPRETKKKNATAVKAISVKTNAKRKGKAVDYVPTAEDLERCNEFENVDAKLDVIYSKEEDDKAKTPLTVGFKELENDGHTMVLRHGNFQHSCEGKLGADNTLCNTPWVAREVEALVRDVTAMTPKAIKTRMKTQYGVEISYWTASNARQIRMESTVGSYDQGYHDLPSLCVEILKSNPGSIARTWRLDETLQWTGTLVAFKASLNGFVKGCRPILGLDGCFLKWKYGGVCLSVLSLDANNSLFPIGVYMCKTECKESWLDFLAKIEPYLSAHPKKLTFISDRQKRLIDSVAEIFPHANHRFCFRYMFKNMKIYHKGEHLERLSWGAARTFRQNEKQKFLNQLGINIPRANDYLEKEPYEHWCRSHFDCTAKCEHITNNFIKHLEYLMEHYEKYDMEGGDRNEWVSISSTGASFISSYHFVTSYVATYSGIIHPVSDDTHWASPPYVVDPLPLQRGRGRPRKERRKGDNEMHKKGSSRRASNAGRERGRSKGTSSGRASNTGRGRGRSEGDSSSSNTGRGRGRAMQTNHQRFVDNWLSNSVPVEAPQSQERPPLVIPPMPPRIDAPVNSYKKTFKPHRQNWRL
ncbi:hypothetical protein GIB67_032355 [Kingdonia uniflora]|uniref:MULE transposase domain-containing protein n=1 Tax=Kingdonia uniflora TaxID=39325 RepID=A0A7J7MIL9_9MAGN|nr:hypothetical protein GIB67_032355 [Kingdonia uniflora]